MNGKLRVLLAGCVVFAAGATVTRQRISAQKPNSPSASRTIPKTWDDAAMATLEVPLADPIGSPRHVPSEYYYKMLVRPIYKQYAIYAPGHEPFGYMDWLKRQEPQIIWDDAGHRPALENEADWIKAGEMVFDAPTGYQGVRAVATTSDVRNPTW
jgi:hypothetical protein